MFPDDINEYLENEDMDVNETDGYVFNGTSFLYDWKTGDFIYKNGAPIVVTGREALHVWIEKVIRTEKFKWRIYEDVDFGPQIEDLIGTNLPEGFMQSELKREITEALSINPYIEEIEDFTFEKVNDIGVISFTVITVEGSFEMEVSLA